MDVCICIRGTARLRRTMYDITTSLTEDGKSLLKTISTDKFHVQPKHIGIITEMKTNGAMNRDSLDEIVLDKNTIKLHNY